MKDEIIFSLGVFACSFILGATLAVEYIDSKQYTGKASCEYVEQAPCKIIYIKGEE